MEQGKATKSSPSSSSSITSELFSSKVPPSSPSKILDSVFPPQSEVPEGQTLVSKMQDSPNEPLKAKPANSANPSEGHEGESRSAANKEESSFFMEPCFPPPCHLSSSIFYGGQDNYPLPQTKKNTVYYDDDESGYATRGNWWKGSFYY
ncbi:hypothetical protein V6N13_100916 [Hibiscus sabdariffa]|uniref:Uncharacterized protein n=1 Tax=Hibiscus sabdariffa TaxID=183260 RepID=A0ABR2QJU6_9ROSI